MTVVGAVHLPYFPPSQLEPTVRAAEQAGLAELWLWEDCFLTSGVATASAALAWSSSLRIGIGLLPVPLRNVALTAIELATLHRLFPGRVIAGIGHGVQSWMGQVGVRPKSPLTLLREYSDALAALLRGEEVTVSGEYVRLDGVKLDHPPLPGTDVGLHLGGQGPRTITLAGELGAGVVISGGNSPDQVRDLVRLVDEGAAGRPRPKITVYVVGTPDRSWLTPERAVAAVAGSPAEVADQLRPWADAGADALILTPPDPDDPVTHVQWSAEVGRALT